MNIFTKYFRGKGVQNTKDDENMVNQPEDYIVSPYRDQEVIEPPKPKTKLITSVKDGVWRVPFESLIRSAAFVWCCALATLFCFRFSLMGIVWMLNRPLIVILVMCLFWCIGYLRVKRVPVE